MFCIQVMFYNEKTMFRITTSDTHEVQMLLLNHNHSWIVSRLLKYGISFLTISMQNNIFAWIFNSIWHFQWSLCKQKHGIILDYIWNICYVSRQLTNWQTAETWDILEKECHCSNIRTHLLQDIQSRGDSPL